MTSINHRITERNSSFELLRIVAMLFIIALHLWLFVFNSPVEYQSKGLQIWGVNSFLYIGANVFILISGYFGIRPKVKSFISLYLCIMFYKGLCYVVDVQYGMFVFSLREFLANTLFCISHSGNWFIEGYVFLYLISPILNVAIDNFDKKTFLMALCLLTVSNLYFGYFWKTEAFNVNGYNGHQFVYLYFIGRYIKLYLNGNKVTACRYYFLSTYIISTVVYICIVALSLHCQVPHWDPWKYNNPLLIISSLSFFLFFCSFDFKSKIVNRIALCAFPALLIHIFPCSLFHFIRLQLSEHPIDGVLMGGAIAAISMTIYLSVIPLEMIRLQLVRPIYKLFDSFSKKYGL